MKTDLELREEIGKTIGEASMLWSETPKGVFDSSRAVELIEKLNNLFLSQRHTGMQTVIEEMYKFIWDNRTAIDGDTIFAKFKKDDFLASLRDKTQTQ